MATPFKSFQMIEAAGVLAFRAATCDEVDCEWQKTGWALPLTLTDEAHARFAHWIRTESGRKYVERPDEFDPACVIFEFAADQQCLNNHQVRIQQRELYVVRDGNHRHAGSVNAPVERRHSGADAWTDDLLTTLEPVRKFREDNGIGVAAATDTKEA